MYLRRTTERRGRRRWLALLLLVLLGAVAARSRGGRPAPGEAWLLAAVEWPLAQGAALWRGAAGSVGEIFRREHLRARVATLEARVAELEIERGRLESARQENERLALLLGLKASAAVPMRAARVLAADPAAVQRSVVIDAGYRDGVRRDAVVVAADGLVGRVLKVGEHTAVVQLANDPAAGMAVVDGRSRVQGVLGGVGPGGMVMRYVPNLEDVKPGDPIETSGLDGIYPPGVRIGVVAGVVPGADSFLSVAVAPAVAFARLETVLVGVVPSGSAGKPAGDGLAAVREPIGDLPPGPGPARRVER